MADEVTVQPQAIDLCPECGALNAKVTDTETYAPLTVIKCSSCEYIYDAYVEE